MSNPDQGGQQNQGDQQDQKAGQQQPKSRTGWPAAGRPEARTAGTAEVSRHKNYAPQC